MKKVLNKTVVFLTISLLIYVLLLVILSCIQVGKSSLIYHVNNYFSWKGGGSYRKFTNYDSEKYYDVIVIGSSRAYRGYDPRIFKKSGLSMYNLGTSAQTMSNTKHIVKNYITSKNCGLLIIDVYEGAFLGNGIESISELVQNISDNKTAMRIAMGLKDPRAVNLMALRLANSNKPPVYTDSNYTISGYTSIVDSANTETIDYSKYGGKKFDNKAHFEALSDILSFAHEENIEVLLVQHPTPKKVDRGWHDSFVEKLEKYTKEFDVNYWDYTFNHSLDESFHFADHNHLNQAGTEWFNTQLIFRMKEDNFVP